MEVNGCDVFTIRDGKIALKNATASTARSFPRGGAWLPRDPIRTTPMGSHPATRRGAVKVQHSAAWAPPSSQAILQFAAPSWRARLFEASLRYLVKPVFTPGVSLVWQRRYLNLLRFTLVGPRGVRRESLELGGVPTVKFSPDGGTRNGSILYWHGGGYAIGSPATHRALASHLCKATQRAVYVPRYRLAPEHPYPAQLQDAGFAWAALYRLGVRPSDLVLMGDSAGGNLALSMLLDGGNAALPLPAALVLISPWVDPLAAVEDDGRDALGSAGWTEQLRSAFLHDGARAGYPSILKADLRDLPPTLIQCAAVELRPLRPDFLQRGCASAVSA